MSESNEVVDQLELDDLDETVVVEPEPVPQEAPSSEPEQPTGEQELNADEPTPEPEPEPEVTETPSAEETPSEVETLRAQLSQLQGVMNKLASGETLVDVQEPQQEKKSVEDIVREQLAAMQPQQQTQKQSEPDATKPLIDEKAYDEIMSSPEKFNEFMQSTLASVQEQAVQQAYALTMQNVPSAVIPSVLEQTRTQHAVQSWASQNQIINDNREIAAKVLEQVDGSNPGMPLEQKLELTLNWMNNTFNGAQAQQNQQPAKPGVQQAAFAQPPRGSAPSGPKLSELQRELEELDSF